MNTRIGRISVSSITLVSVLLVAGCTGTTCPAVLRLDAVVVHFAAAATTDRLTTIRACVDATCAERPLDSTSADQTIAIPMGAGQVTVTVLGSTGNGQHLFAGSTTVTPVVNQPDGPGCQSVYLAKVTMTESGLSPTA